MKKLSYKPPKVSISYSNMNNRNSNNMNESSRSNRKTQMSSKQSNSQELKENNKYSADSVFRTQIEQSNEKVETEIYSSK
jgi:hypothetical protein